MTKEYIEIKPLERKTGAGFQRRRCTITRFAEGTHTDRTELWFETETVQDLPDDEDCDSYVLAVVMEAMRENRDLVVRGRVSKQLLSNLVEYQSIWNKWQPDTYSCITISAEKIAEGEASVPGGICAFSGGVDATFSAWRHSQKKWSHRSQTINLSAMVHGFDIPLDDNAAFDAAFARAQATLSDIGIDLVPIRTNYRALSKVKWEHAFSCALVAVLGSFKKLAGTCLVGSSKSYDNLVFTSGSSPITDPLFSSGGFNVIHDGASHSRTEKVAEIAEWRVGTENLRVCWKGDLKDRNCGKCEKCLRTKLNFLAAGSAIPKCFPDGVLAEELKTVVIPNEAVRAEWQQLCEYGQKHNPQAAWVQLLPGIIQKRKSALSRLLPPGSSRRRLVKKVRSLMSQ